MGQLLSPERAASVFEHETNIQDALGCCVAAVTRGGRRGRAIAQTELAQIGD